MLVVHSASVSHAVVEIPPSILQLASTAPGSRVCGHATLAARCDFVIVVPPSTGATPLDDELHATNAHASTAPTAAAIRAVHRPTLIAGRSGSIDLRVKPEHPRPPAENHADTEAPLRTANRATPSGSPSGFGLLVSCEAGVYVIPLDDKESFTLGRTTECDIVIADASISRRHARLVVGETMTLEDVGSTNGTRVLGRRLVRDERVPVAIGAVFELGSATFVLQKTRGLPLQPGASEAALGRATAGRLAIDDDAPPSSKAPPSVRLGADEPVIVDATMRNLYALLDLVGPSHVSILILGETGVGKEYYAHAVHLRSSRASAPFLQLRCAALPESILEGELFGYEKGAFAGAVSAKAGLFESADGGTVFLDEVGELPLATQAKLLRVIESGHVMRLGALEPQKVDVRLVAATNRELRGLIADGRFRPDLYFRLNGMSMTLPALRNRMADIGPIARRFADRAAATVGKRSITLTARALRALEQYEWPGNVRELKNVIERAVVMCKGTELGIDELEKADPEAFGSEETAEFEPLLPPPRGPFGTLVPPRGSSTLADVRVPQAGGDLRGEVKSLEKQRILDALTKTAGNQSQAAKLLGMSRYTLIARIEEYGLARPRKL